VSIDNVRKRLDGAIEAMTAQVQLVERRGADAYYGDLFDVVPAADYWVFFGGGRLRHVADKVSASLASTGTPSYYVDVQEAETHLATLTLSSRALLVHGRDAASERLVETLASLNPLLPIDVITCDPDALGGVAGSSGNVLTVDVPDSPPPGVEPDLVSLALGDSVLCGLESAMRFSAADFLKDHPKGSLGRNIAAAKAKNDAPAVEYLRPADQALASLSAERDGLASLAAEMDGSVAEAWLDLFRRPWKRIITTGMGKPGYCMRYLALLLNQLGRSAFYVHPAESVHGDLGRIGADSLVIAYTHSGETEELLNILPRTKERGATLLALTNNPASTVGQAATVALKAGAPEVDPIGKAPTGSTTASLALATALVCSDMPGW